MRETSDLVRMDVKCIVDLARIEQINLMTQFIKMDNDFSPQNT